MKYEYEKKWEATGQSKWYSPKHTSEDYASIFYVEFLEEELEIMEDSRRKLLQPSIRKKWRWTFEAFNKPFKIIFPVGFVKLAARPCFPQAAIASDTGGNIIDIPGEIEFAQHFVMFDSQNDFQAALTKYLPARNKTADEATLILSDGCGEAIETWRLYNVKLVNYELAENQVDDIVVTWYVSYDKAVYEAYDSGARFKAIIQDIKNIGNKDG